MLGVQVRVYADHASVTNHGEPRAGSLWLQRVYGGGKTGSAGVQEYRNGDWGRIAARLQDYVHDIRDVVRRRKLIVCGTRRIAPDPPS
jgi:hypothetical protein